MKMNTKEMFQVGYFKFHDNEALNFQLNRFYAQGAFTREELIKIGSQIDGFENWISLFIKIGEEAQNQGDVFKAATCFRAAQFYTLSGEKDADGNSLDVGEKGELIGWRFNHKGEIEYVIRLYSNDNCILITEENFQKKGYAFFG